MSNVAKINLEVHECKKCPFVRNYANKKNYICTNVRRGRGVPIEDETTVPDNCPFIIKRLENAVQAFKDVSSTAIPKKYIGQVEKKQRTGAPDVKFGIDHGWGHISSVQAIGNAFLESCYAYGIIPFKSLKKYQLLFYLAAALHDIGLADTVKNHAAHSAELARKYLQNVDIDQEDVEKIVHAITVHSDGECVNDILDAALIIADKLDVRASRVVSPRDDAIIRECYKIVDAKFEIKGEAGVPTSVELRYTTKGDFNVDVFLSEWPKGILLPKRITNEFLEIPDFKFIVDGQEIVIKRTY
jgi:hypothetical protein